MKSFFLRLKAALLFAQIHPHIEHSPDWTADDTRKLAIFMARTDTGRKFALTIWHHVQACAFRATLERNFSAYECGYASGARAVAAVIDSLQKELPKPAAKPQDGEVPLGYEHLTT